MCAAPVDAPSHFSEFENQGHLGTGSFGDVFRVRRDDGEYALKWLHGAAPPEARARFENEAWALQTLAHPGIPRFIARGEHLGRPWLVMTLAAGCSLEDLWATQVAERAPGGQMRVLDITIAVLDALSYMHGRNIFHRDVKHANIIATESVSDVTLIDFGFCRGVGQPAHAPSFRNVGASRFSPPSKLEYPPNNHRTHDVFAVGVVAYVLLTNEFPWNVSETEDRGRLCDAMLHSDPRTIQTINHFVDIELSNFIHSLLDINDDHRPTAAAALDMARRIEARLFRVLVATLSTATFE